MKTLTKIMKSNSFSIKQLKLFNLNEMTFFWRFKSAENKDKDIKENEKGNNKEVKSITDNLKLAKKVEIGPITDKKLINRRKKIKELNKFVDFNDIKPELTALYKFFLETDNLSWDRFQEYRVMLKSNINDVKHNINLELSNKFICCLKNTEKKKFSFTEEELEAISEVIGTNKEELDNLISEYCIFRAKQQSIRDKVVKNEELPYNKDQYHDAKDLEKYPEYLFLQDKQVRYGFNQIGISKEEYDNGMREKYRLKERTTDCKKLIKEFMRPQY